MTRTQDEILARIEAVEEDMFGWRTEVLVLALDFEHARAFLKPDVTADDWGKQARSDDLEMAAREYYDFALGKVRDHRGLSANRSVLKLAEFAWLLGRDDVVTAMDAAEYPQYGAPKVAAFAKGLGLEWPTDPAMVRMASGLPCEDDCMDGCSS